MENDRHASTSIRKINEVTTRTLSKLFPSIVLNTSGIFLRNSHSVDTFFCCLTGKFGTLRIPVKRIKFVDIRSNAISLFVLTFILAYNEKK